MTQYQDPKIQGGEFPTVGAWQTHLERRAKALYEEAELPSKQRFARKEYILGSARECQVIAQALKSGALKLGPRYHTRPHGINPERLKSFVHKLADYRYGALGGDHMVGYTLAAEMVIVDLVRAITERDEFHNDFEDVMADQQIHQDNANRAETEAGWDATP